MRDSKDSRNHNQSIKKPLNRSGGKIRPQAQQPGSKPVQTSTHQSGKGDTSKLTCYKCGQPGHIATNPKCPQYKKPPQRQMFAAQVIDDRSESDLPDTDRPSEGSEEIDNADPEPEESEDQEGQSDPDDHTDVPDGSQYDEDQTTYEEYDGYAMPSEDDEAEYIRAIHEDEDHSETPPPPPQFEDADWEPRRNEIRVRYERAPWVPHDALEFTPQFSVTHIRGCNVCAAFKEHTVITQAIEGDNSIAWKVRDKFERDLVSLGWTMAFTEDRGRPINALSALNNALEEKVHRLTIEVDTLRLAKDRAITKRKDLEEALELERLDLDLRYTEFDLLQSQCRQIARYCTELENRLKTAGINQNADDPIDNQGLRSLIAQISALPHDDGDIQMRSETTSEADDLSEIRSTDSIDPVPRTVGLIQGPQINGIIDARNGTDNQAVPTYKFTQNDDNNEITIIRIAAARDDDQSKDREFRSAQRRTYATGERPRSSKSDRRCMAALIKVNGLEAYALLDSGSTTVSVTHDFARVAKLDVTQLENPIALQLGTVGSRSVINFGAKASLTLGPIRDDDAYLDVVNIDRYDMIIGTPFMRKHELVMDFGHNTLSYHDQIVPTLSAGQEDLMISRKRAARERPSAPGGTAISRADH
jgi:Aspartyl protease/Zinc knuckle